MRLGEHPSALHECLHLEALGDRVSLGEHPRRLGASRIAELRLVIVFGSDRGDFEGFLSFPWRRAKRYSSGLLMACVSQILCWLCGTLVRVWHVMSISL